MKKVMHVGIGGFGFMIDEDAYVRLNRYLDRFKKELEAGKEDAEIMADVEQRIAELFREGLYSKDQVVGIELVERVIARIGFPGGAERSEEFAFDLGHDTYERPSKRLFRDPDTKMLGGVCGGLAAYFNIDVVLCRAIFLIALVCATAGFWAYIILWIVVPQARTAAEKLQMRGRPVTAENIRKMKDKNPF